MTSLFFVRKYFQFWSNLETDTNANKCHLAAIDVPGHAVVVGCASIDNKTIAGCD